MVTYKDLFEFVNMICNVIIIILTINNINAKK